MSGKSLPIAIIGGGFAGLAAAVDLSEQGRPVLLLEARSFLGGRAYSFTDRTTDCQVDNGQHLFMGCYHRTIDFLGKIGCLDKLKFRQDSQVDFVDAAGTWARFQCPPLPAPWHLVAGLTRMKSLGWSDRLGALRVAAALRRNGSSRDRLGGISVRQWLNELNQSHRMQHRFWDPIALATLNELPESASADMFARVLELAFLRKRSDSTLALSRVGLSELYTSGAARFVAERGGEVRLSAPVERIEVESGKATAVVLRNSERIEIEIVISAVPSFALPSLLPSEAGAGLRDVRAFTPSPIVSINLWFEETVTDIEFIGFLDSPVEWGFNRNAIEGRQGSGQQHLVLVISGAHNAARMRKEELVEMAVREVRRCFPSSVRIPLRHSVVVKEMEATISHSVGLTRLRPGTRTQVPNLLLAGDWTATGLPATIEGAVLSGQEAARAALGL
jgi:hydroxysqualene dehydroxylase